MEIRTNDKINVAGNDDNDCIDYKAKLYDTFLPVDGYDGKANRRARRKYEIRKKKGRL